MPLDLTSGTDWTHAEIKATIESYLNMLRMELAGINFTKTDENQKLRETVKRSKGAIEYKHQNISAVLWNLAGFRFVVINQHETTNQRYRPACSEHLSTPVTWTRLWMPQRQVPLRPTS
jgi:hypothetical protein